MKLVRYSTIFNILICLIFSQSEKEIIFKPAFTIGAGYTKIEDVGAFALPSSYYMEVKILPLLASINFADLAFESKSIPFDRDKYNMDTFSNGQQRCRDKSNGQFVKTELCQNGSETITHYSISFDLNYNLPYNEKPKYLVGLGYRLLNPSTPYLNFIAFYNLFREHDYLVKSSISQDYFHLALYYTIPYKLF